MPDRPAFSELQVRLAQAAQQIAAAELSDDAARTQGEQLDLILSYLGDWLADVAHRSLDRASLARDRPVESAFRSDVIALVGQHRGAGRTPVDDLLGPYFHRWAGTWSELFDAVRNRDPR